MARATGAAVHPVAGCPDARQHLRALDRAERLEREATRLEREVRGRSESLARQFDRVLGVLERWGYVAGWGLTPAGERLARLYHEADLLVAECLETGLFDGLGVAEMAAMASVFTFETRGQGEPAAWWPTARLRQRWPDVGHLHTELNRAEVAAGLPLTRAADPGFAAVAHRWAAGEELRDVIGDEGVSGGDFVRNVKQLVDLLRQLGELAPEPATARTARKAADAVLRGVVAASSVVGTGPLHDPAGASAREPARAPGSATAPAPSP